MKILIYGAGVLGSFYAAQLKESIQNVTLFARGERFDHIQRNGIELVDIHTGQKTLHGMQTINELPAETPWDLVIVFVKRNQISKTLHELSINPNIKNIIFIGSSAGGFEEYSETLKEKHFLIGFPGAGGVIKNNIIYYSNSKKKNGKKLPIIFGDPQGNNHALIEIAKNVFEKANILFTHSQNIEAWLTCHAFATVPFAYGLYTAHNSIEEYVNNRNLVVQTVKAVKEGIKVVKNLKLPVMPGNLAKYTFLPTGILASMAEGFLKDKTTEAGLLGHAIVAKDELDFLAYQIKELTAQSEIETPSLDSLLSLASPVSSPRPSAAPVSPEEPSTAPASLEEPPASTAPTVSPEPQESSSAPAAPTSQQP